MNTRSPGIRAETQDLDVVLEGVQAEADVHGSLARRQAAVLAFGRRTSAGPPLSELMFDAVSLVGEVLDADLRGIAEIEADGRALTTRIETETGETTFRQSALDASQSLGGYALHVARPVILQDLAGESRFSDTRLEALGVASGLAIPLALECRVFGVLSVYARQPNCFEMEDSHFAETVALMLVSSVGRYHAEAELDRVRKVAEEATRQWDDLRSKLEQARSHQHDPDKTDPFDRDGTAGKHAVDQLQRLSPSNKRPPRPFESRSGVKTTEMRSSPRRPYEYQQSIAPMYGGCIPSRKDFVPVECRDISAGGLAFYLSGRPDFDRLVVALGRHPNQTFFTARVVRTEPTERDGHRQYLIGCRFSGRIHV
jgi:hypothetical protein